MREIYRSRNYHPDQIATIYARVDYSGEDWRVEEVNEKKLTIREYVTDNPLMFTQDQLNEMQALYKSRIRPGWTLIRA
jgi:hypothetical protein